MSELSGKTPSPWQPTTDPTEIKLLGKFQEELHELGKVIARIQIQQIGGIDPETGISNFESLEKEMGDVMALMGLTHRRYGLVLKRMEARAEVKAEYLSKWFNMD